MPPHHDSAPPRESSHRPPTPPRRSPPPPPRMNNSYFLSSGLNSRNLQRAMYSDWRVVVAMVVFGFMSTLATTLGGTYTMILILILIIVACVGGFLFYKYNKDRAEAEETERLLNTDLEQISDDEDDDLLNRYR